MSEDIKESDLDFAFISDRDHPQAVSHKRSIPREINIDGKVSFDNRHQLPP